MQVDSTTHDLLLSGACCASAFFVGVLFGAIAGISGSTAYNNVCVGLCFGLSGLSAYFQLKTGSPPIILGSAGLPLAFASLGWLCAG
jgi:hypothetical protein